MAKPALRLPLTRTVSWPNRLLKAVCRRLAHWVSLRAEPLALSVLTLTV